MAALAGWATLLAVPLVLLAIVLVIAWWQDRRRPWTRRARTHASGNRWGVTAMSRVFHLPEEQQGPGWAEHSIGTRGRPRPAHDRTAPGDGPHDRPSYLD